MYQVAIIVRFPRIVLHTTISECLKTNTEADIEYIIHEEKPGVIYNASVIHYLAF